MSSRDIKDGLIQAKLMSKVQYSGAKIDNSTNKSKTVTVLEQQPNKLVRAFKADVNQDNKKTKLETAKIGLYLKYKVLEVHNTL